LLSFFFFAFAFAWQASFELVVFASADHMAVVQEGFIATSFSP
jgi:hypothetical protein